MSEIEFHQGDAVAKIRIGYCGSHSITGAVQDLVNSKGLEPSLVVVVVEKAHPDLNLNSELAEAQRLFASRPYRIELGNVNCISA